MKKFFLLSFLLFTPIANANLNHTISSSVKLTVGGAMTSMDRLGTSYSVSGNGVDTTYTSGGSAVSNGVGSLTVSSGVGAIPELTVTQDNPANSFSFSQSFTQGDALSGSAPTVGEVPNYSADVISTAGGTAGNLAGTITTAGSVAITAGGHNTEAVGQVTTTLVVD
tara:strand:+ start:231 stop:731 length:501 start_codon:yes stop_codon:yes gene_type:complete